MDLEPTTAVTVAGGREARSGQTHVFSAGLSAGGSLTDAGLSRSPATVPQRDWAALPKDELNRVRAWAAALAEVAPPIVPALERVAAQCGVSYSTARARYYAWLKSDRDPWALVSGYVMREPATALHPEFRAEWHRRFCAAQRSGAAAYRRLVQDFRRGVAIPGVPDDCDRRILPPGWSKPNLMRHKPAKSVVTTLRIGPAAAAQMRPLVYTTREGLWVGSHYLFDDLWHDLMVNVQDTTKTGRPLEFDCMDLFSGAKIAWGFRVRTKADETGRMEGLTEQMMRWLVAHVLVNIGFDAERGTVLVVEHGTAAIREALAALIRDLTGGKVTVHRGGMQGRPAFVGAYAGRSIGNPRFKSPLESLRNLIHNECDHLLGQTGKDVAHRPEGLHGLLRENDELLRVAEVLRAVRPDLAPLLRMPLLNHVQFADLLLTIYGQINRSTEHRLEGWATQVCPADDGLTMRRLSRWEVWEAGRGRLTRLDARAASVLVWNAEEAVERPVRSRMIEVWTKELSTDVLRFNARHLEEGETYHCQVSPIDPSLLYAYNARGDLAGVCPLIPKVCRTDTEALQAQFGRIAKEHAEDRQAVAAVGADLIRRRIDDIRHNDALLREAGLSGKRRPEVQRMADSAARAGRAMATTISREATTPKPAVVEETLDVRNLSPVEEPEVDVVDVGER